MRKFVGTGVVGKTLFLVFLFSWSQWQLCFDEKRQKKKKPVRLRLTYEKEKHPEVHLTYFESLEFLKSFGCVEFENLLDWKIVKCTLLMMLCWSLLLVIGMSLIMEGKNVSRNTENSALCVDSVLKECLFFFFLVLVCFYWVMWNVFGRGFFFVLISAAPWSQDPYREQGVSLDTTCYIF